MKSVKEIKLWHIVSWFFVVFLVVCGVLFLYFLAFRFDVASSVLGVPALEGTLELFEKTFGLAVNILIAGVAILLAVNSLAVSRAQAEISDRQHRIELKALELQVSMTAPDATREVIDRAREAVRTSSAIIQACNEIARVAETAEDDHWHAQQHYSETIDDSGNVFYEETDDFRKAEKAASDKRKALLRRHTLNILELSRELVRAIARHPDSQDRNAAVRLHFGSLIDVMTPYLVQSVELLADDDESSMEAARLGKAIAITDRDRRNLTILGYLVNSKLFKCLVDKTGGRVPFDATDLGTDIATGRYIDLNDALNFLKDGAPIFQIFTSHDDTIRANIIAALVSTALDLNNPHRFVAAERAKLALLNPEATDTERLVATTHLGGVSHAINAALGVDDIVFSRDLSYTRSGFAALTRIVYIGTGSDEEGLPISIMEERTVSLAG